MKQLPTGYANEAMRWDYKRFKNSKFAVMRKLKAEAIKNYNESGDTLEAAKAVADDLSTIINVQRYLIDRLCDEI